MDTFLDHLASRLKKLGFKVETNPGRITVDGLGLGVEWVSGDDGKDRVRFCGSSFTINGNKVPNLDKAVGLAVQRVIVRKNNRMRHSETRARGRDSTITPAPGNKYTLTVVFDDEVSASAALDCLMECGLVQPAEEDK